MVNKTKIIGLLLLLYSFLGYSQVCEQAKKLFENDLYSSKELREYASKAEDSDKVFDAWQILHNENLATKTNVTILKEVENNYQAITNAGGYVKWKNLQGVEKSELLTKFKDFTHLKSWISGLDNVADVSILSKLDNLETSYFSKLDADLIHPTYGSEIKALLKESPDDLVDVWKKLKDDPAFSWELQKTGGSRWEKWSQREFFKDITAKGKGFETNVCLATFKNRSSAKYLELKQKFQTDFSKNLDDYDMYNQVQLKYDGDNYFVADQLFVKRNLDGDIVDMVVIENKLSSTTPLTTPQSTTFTKTSFTVRSLDKFSEMGSGLKLDAGTVINFKNSKQLYKVHDGANGDVISGIIKL